MDGERAKRSGVSDMSSIVPVPAEAPTDPPLRLRWTVGAPWSRLASECLVNDDAHAPVVYTVALCRRQSRMTMGTLGWIMLTLSAGAIVTFMRHKVGGEIDRGSAASQVEASGRHGLPFHCPDDFRRHDPEQTVSAVLTAVTVQRSPGVIL
jgi:hypothetical protein